MSVLEEIFYGNLCPTERFVKRGSDYDKISCQLVNCTEKLLAKLTQEEQKLFEEVENTASDLAQIEGREWFMEGFCLGSKLTEEIWQYESRNFEKCNR